MSEDKVGRFVKIYMKNGYLFQGAVRSWSEREGISIKSVQNELIFIPSISEISAYVFIVRQDGSFLMEHSSSDVEPTPKISPTETMIERAKSLVELHKMKAASELDIARTKLRAPTCTADSVEYDTISVLRTLKNDPRKQNRPSKRRNSS